MMHHTPTWEGTPLEELGRHWARLGLEPMIAHSEPMRPGDVVQPKGTNYRMVVVRKVGRKERMARWRLAGQAPSRLPYCYIVTTD